MNVKAIKDLNVDLTSWMRSLNNVSNHTMIDVKDNSLYPLSDLYWRKTSNNVLMILLMKCCQPIQV